jgi:hypothetical protein
MFRFLHIGFSFPGVPKMRDLEPAISLVGDWIRYSALSWIVWTDKPVPEVYQIIARSLDTQDQVLIAALNISDSIGILSPWIWTWINSKTIQPSIQTRDSVSELFALINPSLPPKK